MAARLLSKQSVFRRLVIRAILDGPPVQVRGDAEWISRSGLASGNRGVRGQSSEPYKSRCWPQSSSDGGADTSKIQRGKGLESY